MKNATNMQIIAELKKVAEEVFRCFVTLGDAEGSFTASEIENEKDIAGNDLRVSFSPDTPEYTVNVGTFNMKFDGRQVFRLLWGFEHLEGLRGNNRGRFSKGVSKFENMRANVVYTSEMKQTYTPEHKRAIVRRREVIQKYNDFLALIKGGKQGVDYIVLFNVGDTWYGVASIYTYSNKSTEEQLDKYLSMPKEDYIKAISAYDIEANKSSIFAEVARELKENLGMMSDEKSADKEVKTPESPETGEDNTTQEPEQSAEKGLISNETAPAMHYHSQNNKRSECALLRYWRGMDTMLSAVCIARGGVIHAKTKIIHVAGINGPRPYGPRSTVIMPRYMPRYSGP